MATIEHIVEPERPGSPNVANVPGGIAVSERGPESEEQRERVRMAVAEKILHDAEDEAKSKGVKDIVRMTEQGDAADEILECAERESVDLIVMGTRGLSDFKGLLMGSVSHKVAQRSPCTCITVK
jgi:nucleotide-binding universal stress UspA family protein